MTTVICIMILAYLIMGERIDPLLERVKDVDWKAQINGLIDKIRPYALKAGRTAARPLLQFYYVMKDSETTTLEKVLIYAAIIYIVSPTDLIPAAVYNLLGVLDDGAAAAFVYKKIKDKITPEINARVDATLDEWFGASVATDPRLF